MKRLFCKFMGEHWCSVVSDSIDTVKLGSTKALCVAAILLKWCSGWSCDKLTGSEGRSSIKHEL